MNLNMSKLPIEYLNHISDEIQYILSVITDEITRDSFLRDEEGDGNIG